MLVLTASVVTEKEESDRLLNAILVFDDGSQGRSQDGKGVRNNYLVDSLLVRTTWPMHLRVKQLNI